jgi:hypothetical protein
VKKVGIMRKDNQVDREAEVRTLQDLAHKAVAWRRSLHHIGNDEERFHTRYALIQAIDAWVESEEDEPDGRDQ